MKKILILFTASLLLVGCASKKLVSDTQTDRTSDRIQAVDYIHKTILKDSVVIRDSMVYHADGSKSTYHSEKSQKSNIQKIYYKYFSKLVITKRIVKTVKEVVTKTRRDFIWFTGLLTYLAGIIFIIYKLNKRFSLWQTLKKVLPGTTKGL